MVRQPSLLGERDVRFGQRGGFDLAVQQCIEPIARAVRGPANLDHLARHEAFQHVQRDVVRAEIERQPDQPIGHLLRRVNGRVRPNHERRIGDDGAAAELAAVLVGVLDAAVVAPFAGVVHVGLALLEQLAVAGERIDALGRGDVDLDLLFDADFAVGPLDVEAFLGEQAFVIGHDFGKPLEWRGGFQNQLFHCVLRRLD